MNDPPTPGKAGTYSSLLALLTWSQVKLDPGGTGIGRLLDGAGAPHYVAAVNVAGATTWKISTTAPGGGVTESLMTSATATILKSGTTNADGTITYAGTTYALKLYFDGANLTARAV